MGRDPAPLSDLLVDALRIAIDAHAGKFDRAGQPYILHPLAVMQAVASLPEKVVAVLHDAIEDSPLSPAQLQARGFPEDILAALAAITRSPGEPYEDYIARVRANDLARTVKIADLKHNLDLSRLTSVGQVQVSRVERYVKALTLLTADTGAAVDIAIPEKG